MRHKGFTLIEVMVAMVIALVIMTTIYSVYYSQQKMALAQEQIAAMQQNLRAAMTLITKDIRMAGYNPSKTLNTGIVIAEPEKCSFTWNNNGELEQITYSLYESNDVDNKDDTLGRKIDDKNNTNVAENIQVLNFVYLDAQRVPVIDPSHYGTIRSIQVTMIAKTEKGDSGFTDTDVYRNQQGDIILDTPGDNLRRRILTREIKCRNLGL